MTELWSTDRKLQVMRAIDELAFQINLSALQAAVAAGGETAEIAAQSRLRAALDTAIAIHDSMPNLSHSLAAAVGLPEGIESAPVAIQARTLSRFLGDLRRLVSGTELENPLPSASARHSAGEAECSALLAPAAALQLPPRERRV
jgi:hypothetical protein